MANKKEMEMDKLITVINYKTINSTGVETINIALTVADQTKEQASALLLAIMSGAASVPEAQVTTVA